MHVTTQHRNGHKIKALNYIQLTPCIHKLPICGCNQPWIKGFLKILHLHQTQRLLSLIIIYQATPYNNYLCNIYTALGIGSVLEMV